MSKLLCLYTASRKLETQIPHRYTGDDRATKFTYALREVLVVESRPEAPPFASRVSDILAKAN